MLVETCQNLISNFEGRPPTVPDLPSEDDMDPWRDRIDALDRAILQMLNERAVCANVIGRIKKQLMLPVYVPAREEEVLRNVTESNAGPLSEAAVRRLFERIIDETRSLERQMHERDEEER